MALKYIDEAALSGKKVIARFDFNVPMKSGKITDTTRIDMALPTIRHILEKGASKLIMMSHLGRPDGQINPKYSLEPVAAYLQKALNMDIVLTQTALDSGIKAMISLPKTKLVLLENIRYHAEEEDNDTEFAKTLASYADIYVNDAFGAAHRKHASTYAINQFFKGKAYGGFLLKKEVEALTKIVDAPVKPFFGIVGGAKVADKIKTIERLLTTVDNMFIGGAMAYPFLKAKGFNIGKSLCSPDDFELAKKILATPGGSKVLLPIDHIVSESLEGAPEECADTNIPDSKMGMDIGPKTCAMYSDKLRTGKTIFWNGPMGLFENDNFAKGTYAVAKALAESSAFTLVGGGDSVTAVNKSGLADRMSHISTGGGASLEFIEKGELPGVQALKFGL